MSTCKIQFRPLKTANYTETKHRCIDKGLLVHFEAGKKTSDGTTFGYRLWCKAHLFTDIMAPRWAFKGCALCQVYPMEWGCSLILSIQYDTVTTSGADSRESTPLCLSHRTVRPNNAANKQAVWTVMSKNAFSQLSHHLLNDRLTGDSYFSYASQWTTQRQSISSRHLFPG